MSFDVCKAIDEEHFSFKTFPTESWDTESKPVRQKTGVQAFYQYIQTRTIKTQIPRWIPGSREYSLFVYGSPFHYRTLSRSFRGGKFINYETVVTIEISPILYFYYASCKTTKTFREREGEREQWCYDLWNSVSYYPCSSRCSVHVQSLCVRETEQLELEHQWLSISRQVIIIIIIKPVFWGNSEAGHLFLSVSICVYTYR